MAGTAIQISGRSLEARSAFLNDVYEPMQLKHNDRPAYVARGVSSRYLFHTGKDRWVVSRVLDDGGKCWAFVKAGNSSTPCECGGPWTVCDADDQWRPDAAMKCVSVPASDNVFVQLRLSLEDDMKKYGLIEQSDLKKLWRRLDFNGNNVVSLAEIDKFVVEMVTGGVWPDWMNNKPALMRAYKKTILKDGDGDDWVQKKEFHALLLNLFWFNKLWKIFDSVDTDHDKRVDLKEFIAGMGKMNLKLSEAEGKEEFKKIDVNGGGKVLFVEMCAYIRKVVSPDEHPEFDADIASGEHCGKVPHPTTGAPTRMSHQDMFRARGDKATHTHIVKQKAMADFDGLEEQLKTTCKDPAKMKEMWHHLDFNNNGSVSLAELDKWVVETYALLNHKPALMRCFKQTTSTSEKKDDYVHAKDFSRLLVNLFYFNKLFWIFDECDGDDRRMTLQEFKMCMTLCGVPVTEDQAQKDFKTIDKNGGGMVLFDEFCAYFASKACPEIATNFLKGAGAGAAAHK